HQLGRPARHHALEGVKQRLDLARAAIQPFWNDQAVGYVVCGDRECVDPAVGFPLCEAAPEVALDTGGGLVTILGGLGSSFMTMAETTSGTSFRRSVGGSGRLAMWACTHAIGSDAVNGRLPVNNSYSTTPRP